MTKTGLRAEFRRLLREQPRDELEAACRALEDRVVDWCGKNLPSPRTITLFGGLPGEPDLAARAAEPLRAMGHRTALFAIQPESDSGEMESFVVETSDAMRRGPRGIWEPDPARCKRLAPEELDVIWVPGLFFCPDTGARLGRGGGYFDRYLARTPEAVWKIGAALDWQLRAGLPVESHDQRMHGLLAESRWIGLADRKRL